MYKSIWFILFSMMFTLQAQETLLLRHPSVHEDRIAFAYASDIWISSTDGSAPRRLTVNPDVEFNPVLSPDGKWVAFTGNYAGNNDVYVVSAEGGSPKRLTFHPGADVVRGWHGNEIIYSSAKESAVPRYTRLFTVNAQSGAIASLILPEASQGTISPDGKFIAYIKVPDPSDGNRNYRPFNLYRGGLMPKVWIFDMQRHSVEEIPGSSASNNTRPVWLNDQKIYFLSDRDNRTVNVYSYDRSTKAVSRVTNFSDYDVRSLHTDGRSVVFEQAGRIHRLDPAKGTSQPVSVRIHADITTNRPQWVKASGYIRQIAVSPTGVRAAVEARGEILTVPVEKGDIRNLTNSPGVHDRAPVWSPDGRYIAFFSDEGGEYQLALQDQLGKEKRILINPGKGNYFYNPVWSGDSKKILYHDKHLNLYYIDIRDKKPVLIDSDLFDRPDAFFAASWSPDNKWIVYNRKLKNNLRALFLYNLAGEKSTQITDGLSEASMPSFSRDGKYIFFKASTNYGRSVGWLDMSSFEVPVRDNLYAIVLDKDEPSLLEPQSDEEKINGGDSTAKKSAPASSDIVIDLTDIQQRIVALDLPAKSYSALQGNAPGKLFYLERDPGGGPANLMVYDIAKRKAELFLNNVSSYRITADGKKIGVQSGGSFSIVPVNGKPNPAEGRLDFSAITVLSDPKKEWEQMFSEVWRIERDFFYVENLHGADWKKVRTKYEKFLPHVAHREDLNYLFNQMMGELVIGHNYVSQGDFPEAINVNVGLLGADYTIDQGRYRFSRIYEGLSWNPEFKAPLTQPGIAVREGDYLIEVNGMAVTAKENIYSFFQNMAAKQVTITVNSKPSLDGARRYTVVPLANESNLRLINWVEGNRKKVSDLSGGKLAYVYLPNTGGGGYTFFNRYYYAQLDKQGVIIDERFNGGGSAADYIVDILSREVSNYWKNRDGEIMKTPEAVIDGPKAMLINGYAASGGDLLPYLFKQKKLGPLVGTTTMGILVGIYNYPELMDGGSVTAPRLGIFSKDGKYIIENEGVAADVEVEMNPADVIRGRDPQLEKAVELLMKDIKPTKIIVPKDPVRANQF